MTAKYGSRNEAGFRMPKPMRTRMKVVAAMGGYKTMLEWLETKITEDEKKYGIVQNGGPVGSAKPELQP